VAIVSGHGPYVCAVVGGPIDPFVFGLMRMEVEFGGSGVCAASNLKFINCQFHEFFGSLQAI